MAVQAGHLNPQILNQPLAPQTLVSLNQLLQQIKTLQTLQQQHSMAQSQKPMGGNSGLLAVSVNITKTKQNITNLQNQVPISLISISDDKVSDKTFFVNS
jgi:trinucleotide repeat-containing gene 6 protein